MTGNQAYATNAINIMNAYATHFKGYAGTNGLSCPSGTDCSNGPLQSGWDSEKWPRAAEIIRYGKTSSGAGSSAPTLSNVTYHAEVGSNQVCSFNLPLGGNLPN